MRSDDMTFTIQLKVNEKTLNTFIKGMENNGYEMKEDDSGNITFWKNGKITANHQGYRNFHDKKDCYIGIRP